MAWLSAAGKFVGGVVGKMFVGDKGLVEQVSDIADKWHPSKTTIHTMSLEDQTAGDSSQSSARAMAFISHDSWLDIAVDGLSRLPRPAFAIWAFCVLVGWVAPPSHLADIHPIALNIIWTVVTFYFGARVIIKDIPAAIRMWQNGK